MALPKMTGPAGINPLLPNDAPSKSSNGNPASATGSEFRRMLDQFASQTPVGQKGSSGTVGIAPPLKFSNHAVERMNSRGIIFQPDEMQNIERAVSKAAQKGAKDTLVLSGDNALIVSVKNNTVVTVMDREAMKENVFTNIDSTVVV